MSTKIMYQFTLPLKLVSIGMLLGVLSIGFVACGSGQQTTQVSPTPTKPVVQSPMLPKNCGNVRVVSGRRFNDEATTKQTEDCFWQAYQHCNPASLAFTSTGVDTVSIQTFTLKNSNNHCSIFHVAQVTIVPKGLGKPRTNMCAGLIHKPDGLHLSACGQDGDILVPS